MLEDCVTDSCAVYLRTQERKNLLLKSLHVCSSYHHENSGRVPGGLISHGVFDVLRRARACNRSRRCVQQLQASGRWSMNDWVIIGGIVIPVVVPCNTCAVNSRYGHLSTRASINHTMYY